MLASDGTFNRVICKHCRKRDAVRQTEALSSPEDTEEEGTNTGDTSESTKCGDPRDSDYVDAKETKEKKGNTNYTSTRR